MRAYERDLALYKVSEARWNRRGHLSVRQLDALIEAHTVLGNPSKVAELEAERVDRLVAEGLDGWVSD